MSDSLVDILDHLERIAHYDGTWTALKKEGVLLRQRLGELRERQHRLDDLLVIALVGGSGVGKSTLLNALAGDELAETSELRPCTSTPTVYHPPGAQLAFAAEWNAVSGSALENLVIIDTPDSDTVVREHRTIVSQVLAQCDLICLCADSEKYLDEATWSLLRPLQSERALVCIETKSNPSVDIAGHWTARIAEEGFDIAGYFRVDSRRTLDRKLRGGEPQHDEFDFTRLEVFLDKELTTERIGRIKRFNAAGLLHKTFNRLEDGVCRQAPRLAELQQALTQAEADLANAAHHVVRQRLFAEPHLWSFALGREMTARAKGGIGALYRLLETIRTLPARLAAWPLRSNNRGAGHRAASLLLDEDLISANLDFHSEELKSHYLGKHREVILLMAQRGFESGREDSGFGRYVDSLNEDIAAVLQGPARQRLVKNARRLTSWPVALISDIPPGLFVGYSGYKIVRAYFDYFASALLPGAFFVHAAAVLGIILAVELIGLAMLARLCAWTARRASVGDLRNRILGARSAFTHEREAIGQALASIEEIQRLNALIQQGAPAEP